MVLEREMLELTGWRDMPAGFDLDTIIAELSGWTEIEKVDFWAEDYADVYLNTRLRGVHPEGGELIPEYSSDLNAAIALVDGKVGIVMLSQGTWDDHKWDCAINSVSSRSSDIGMGQADSPALAVVRAWLDWKGKNI